MAIAAPPIEIMLIEDNAADVRLTVEALKETRVAIRLQVARDGVEAMRMLKEPNAATPRPDLILLDLNLPRKDGREVLQEIKQDDALRHIPVVILSTSQAEQDILQSYRLGANAFITKPVEIDQFFDVVRSLDQFWLTVAKLARP
jgi:CheY-like chemotaxis protein